jgi:tripartite ATP-independent transporter DctM subunit
VISVLIWVSLIVLLFIGVPIAYAMGLASVLMLKLSGVSSSIVIAQKAINGLDSFVVLAIPFFMMAASVMSQTGVGNRIFRFAGSLVRHLPGGMGHVNVLTSMILAGMSGSSVSDVSGIGKMEIEAMEDAGYDRDFSAAVTAASSTIAPIIPPSTSMVLYGSITGVSIGRLLIGGLFPGIMMGLVMMILVYIISVRRKYPIMQRVSMKELLSSFVESIPPLLMPVILLGGIIGGFFTPTEGACVATVYAIFLGMVFYRNLNFKQLFKVFENTSSLCSATLMVMACSSIFGLVLTKNQIPQKLSMFFISLSNNPKVIMFYINVLLIILGCFMEGNSIYIILGPILGQLAVTLGADPVHFGVMVVFNLTLGLITPPVGLCLFLTQRVARISSGQMVRAIWPFIIVLFIALGIVTYWPAISTWLPNLVMK